MKDSVLVDMNVWQLARLCECVELYTRVAGKTLDDIERVFSDWMEINEYTRFVLDDIEEAFLRMNRVPHMEEKYGRLITVIERVKEGVL